MACCGKKSVVPPISLNQKKIIDKVRSSNYGAIKRGNVRVTAYTRQCFGCNTLVSNVKVCPICGYKL